MAQTWLRVETDRPLRHLAPVSFPPPSLEGIDKVFQHPFELRSFSSTVPASGAAQHVRLFRLANEDKLGTVSIACGGWDVRPSDAGNLATFALHALRSSSKKGACELMDSCASQAPGRAHASPDAYGGATHSRQPAHWGASAGRRFLPPSRGAGAAHRKPATLESHFGEWEDTALFWESQKANTHHFVTITSAVPMSPLFCIALPAEAVASTQIDVLIRGHGWAIGVPSAAVAEDAVAKGTSILRKERLPLLQKHLQRASRVYRGLFLCAARMLRSAFPESAIGSDLMAATSLVESTHATLFFAFVTLSGIALASPTFFSRTTHWEKLLIASYAMDRLIPKAAMLDVTVNPDAAQTIQLHEFPLRLSRLGQSTVTNVVVMSIGSVVAVVLAFPSQAPPYSAAAFSTFVREKLMTRDTISPVIEKRMRRCSGLTTVSTADTHTRQLPRDDSQAPVFPGLQGRGLTSVAHHVTICTAQPGEIGLAKLMDDQSTSDDESSTGLCGCVGESQADRVARQLEHIVELVAHDALEGLLLRYASRVRRIDETAFVALRVHHVAAMTALLVSSPTSVPFFQQHGSPHRVMPDAYKAFEVCWWRHLAAQPFGKIGIPTVAAMPTLLRPVIDATINALLMTQCEPGSQVPLEPCLSCENIDCREVVQVEDQNNNAVVAGPISVVTHADAHVLLSEPHSALATSAILERPVDCSQWSVDFHRLGFRARAHDRPIEMTEEAWKLTKGMQRHFRALLHFGMQLQHVTR